MKATFKKIILLQQRLGDHGVALFQDRIDIIAVFVQLGEDEDENLSGFLAVLWSSITTNHSLKIFSINLWHVCKKLSKLAKQLPQN